VAGYVYRFEWDPAKARTNQTKHAVSFELAASVFKDALMVSVYDGAHSETEERWATLGKAENGKLLVVIHTFAETGGTGAVVRMISAREATKSERQSYEETPR
jgi:uncharacterized protein